MLVALGAALLWLPLADNVPAAQPPGADWSRPHSVQSGDITVYYPRGWTASVEESTIVVRSGGTRIMLIDYGTTQAGYFPPRPDRFKLDDDDRRFLSCVGFEGWNVSSRIAARAYRRSSSSAPGRRSPTRPKCSTGRDRLAVAPLPIRRPGPIGLQA